HAGCAVLDEARVEAAGMGEERLLVGGGDCDHEAVDIGHGTLLYGRAAAGCRRRGNAAGWGAQPDRRSAGVGFDMAPVRRLRAACLSGLAGRFIGRSTDSGGAPYTGKPPTRDARSVEERLRGARTPHVQALTDPVAGQPVAARLPRPG